MSIMLDTSTSPTGSADNVVKGIKLRSKLEKYSFASVRSDVPNPTKEDKEGKEGKKDKKDKKDKEGKEKARKARKTKKARRKPQQIHKGRCRKKEKTKNKKRWVNFFDSVEKEGKKHTTTPPYLCNI